MNFSEKLISLRKKEGLSQEELGYKLNVTRQTVSKWELGQTTPDMDKLSEMAKIFNISVDQLINGTETMEDKTTVIEDQPIDQNEKRSSKNKIIIFILVGALIIVLGLMAVKIFTGGIGKSPDSMASSFFDKFFGLFDKAIDTQQQMLNNVDNDMLSNKVENMFYNVEDILTNYSQNGIAKEQFNSTLEMYSGTKMGASVFNVLDKINTSNKKQDRKITVKYMDIETQDEAEIRNIKKQMDQFEDYELYFEYDEEGYINKAIIEKF